jgi:hypothetical protein
MKRVIKPFIPKPIRKVLWGINYTLEDKRNSKRTVREVFTEIYMKGKWGGQSGEFHSGEGSSTESVIQPYVRKIIEYFQSYAPNKLRLVDLGCGDFKVGRNFVEHCSEYICVDIVPDLIQKLKAANYSNNVKFLCLDIVDDDLPDGDICFLRQVLQHLSNEQIIKILQKLKKYKTIFITEHYPTDNPQIVPNRDKVHGARVRVYNNSGVYLDKTPFNIPTKALQLFLEVPGVGLSGDYDLGVIRTYKLEFGKDS